MRITSSYIIDPLRLPVSNATESSAREVEKQQKTQQAQDSYQKNSASSQVIDAEYVDLYNSTSNTVHKQNPNLNVILESDTERPSQGNNRVQQNRSSLDIYHMTAVDTPPPGTYLNIFA